MAANSSLREDNLTDAAVAWLRERLPATWTIDRSARSDLATGTAIPDAAIDVRNSSGMVTTVVVEAKERFRPRDVDQLLGTVGLTLRRIAGHIPILVVASWLSAATRDRLTAEGINYIDLTGNALVRLDTPTLFIQTTGAQRSPFPTHRGKARVRGPRAGRLVRFLVDVRPPYGVRQVAHATGINAGYVSRLFETLDDEALVERAERGRVVSVDIAGVVRRWSESYDLFKTNASRTFIAGAGVRPTLVLLTLSSPRFAVTGSFAAVRHAAVAAPALLSVYCEDPDQFAIDLNLLPATEGINVALLTPFDGVVWDRTEEAEGITYVAPSQAAVDCLTGNGRMPAEGDALLEWMVANEPVWRRPSIEDEGGDA